MSIGFVKGHGTQNDFVVLFDPDGVHDPTESQVRALCDRRRGLGADGVLRAVPVESAQSDVADAAQPQWFMDYRNADGSVAEMCGNGARVFALALRDAGLVVADTFAVMTRGGVRDVTMGPAEEGVATVTVAMGTASADGPPVTVSVRDKASGASGDAPTWAATAVWVPNPHAVAVVDDLADAGRLTAAPAVTPAEVFPDGVNVEFVVDRGVDPVADDGTLRIGMRVHERGVGETRSCGTGAVAAAWVWRRRAASSHATVRVDVPGGTVYVTERDDGELELRGPAVLVARGTIDDAWWKATQ